MNKICIVGNLTRDPELRATGSGISVCTFTVAVNRRFKDQNGEIKTDFIPVVAWRQQGENCAKYLSKGSRVAVSGAVQVRSYTDRDGGKRYVTEIQADEVEFLSAKREEETRPHRTEEPGDGGLREAPEEQDDLPF